MVHPSVDHPYPFPLVGSRPSAILYTGNIYDVTMDTPRDMELSRKRRHIVSSSAKLNVNGTITNIGAVSESIAMHQRKLRDTEARIDHALDLVTRSFGVSNNTATPNNEEPSLPSRRSAPHSPEVRRIRETLTKTQRVPPAPAPSSEEESRRAGPGQSVSVKGKALDPYQSYPSGIMRGVVKSPLVISKKKKGSQGRSKVSSNSDRDRDNNKPPVRIYKATPIISPYYPSTTMAPTTKKIESQKEFMRSQIIPIIVIQGNTHIYEKNNSDFTNTFGSMESFKEIDDSNPAGLPRFRTKIDMCGFLDSEISFECDGKKLIISGTRARKNTINERKVVEVVELPPGVFSEKLRIARDKEGVLHIEERWTIS